MISVIVPIYNVEQYLDKCIDSIIKQTYTDLEIILVDDGSPDHCASICDHYAKKDHRIVVIHKQNGGLSDARNAGISVAKGDYIGFVDADDYIHPQMYEILYQNLVETEADISVCEFACVQENSNINGVEEDLSLFREVITKDSIMELLEYMNTITVVAWNKLYCSRLFENIRYPYAKVHEDEFVIHHILHECQKVVYSKAKLYFYLQRKEGITGQIRWKHVADGFEAYIDRIHFLKENDYSSMEVLSVIQMLNYIIKYYDKIAKVKQAKGLVKKFRVMFKMYYKDREVQNNLGRKKLRLFKCFVISPDLYYSIEVILEKGNEAKDRVKKKFRNFFGKRCI